LVGSKAPGVTAKKFEAVVVLDKAAALVAQTKDPVAMADAATLLDDVGQKVPAVAAD